MNLFEYEQGFARRILMVLYHGKTVYCLLQDLWGGFFFFFGIYSVDSWGWLEA